jgi:hypothetical protein
MEYKMKCQGRCFKVLLRKMGKKEWELFFLFRFIINFGGFVFLIVEEIKCYNLCRKVREKYVVIFVEWW